MTASGCLDGLRPPSLTLDPVSIAAENEPG